MDKFWTLCRFVGSVAVYYITPTPPDFELTQADCDNIDITPKVLAWLAMPLTEKSWPPDKRLVLHYKYKGRGPFITYFDPEEPVVFPPPDIEAIKSVENCLVSAEITVGEDIIDITERAEMLAGPDGRWHGKTLDKAMLLEERPADSVVTLLFADGKEMTI